MLVERPTWTITTLSSGAVARTRRIVRYASGTSAAWMSWGYKPLSTTDRV